MTHTNSSRRGLKVFTSIFSINSALNGPPIQLNILLFIPVIGFGQGLLDCALLSVTDVVIQNDSIIFEVFNADTMDSHYPYISATLDGNGDTIQSGQMDWYVTPGGVASYYYYTNFSGNYVNESVNPSNSCDG